MKKRNLIILIVIIVFVLLFFGMTYFIGTQVFMGSTQLVTCEDTTGVKDTFWEKYDLIDYIDYVYGYAPEQEIGIWATSFGGATAGLAIGEQDVERKVDFLILDCPVSDMKWMVEEEMRKMDIGLPISYMTFCGNIINKIQLGFGYEDANVCDTIIDISTPVLVINSEADALTPQFMGQDIYDAIHNDAIKMIWTVDDSEHTEIWLDYNQEYREKIEEILNSLK